MRIPQLPRFRHLLMLVLGCMAVGAAPFAGAQNISWSAASGAPAIPNPKTPGLFVWHVKNEVYMTTESDTKKNHKFIGSLVVNKGGKITGLVGSKLESDDKLSQPNSTTVTFNFVTSDGRDAFHFKLTGGTLLTFSATYDGAPAISLIYYGPKATAANREPVVFNLAK